MKRDNFILRQTTEGNPSPRFAGRGRRLVCRNLFADIPEKRRVRARGLQGAAKIVVT
jgi:hypothetical protein